MYIGLCYTVRQEAWPKWSWIQSAFERLGHRVVQFDTIENLREFSQSCDLILFEHRWPGRVHANHIVEDSEKQRKSLYIQWYFDVVNWHDDQVFEINARVMRCMDGVLVKERGLLQDYRDRRINALWFDQGCPDEMPAVVHSRNPEFDVCLFGQSGEHYKQRQLDVMALVDAGFKVAWAGTPHVPPGVKQFQWVHPMELPAFMSMAAVTLCVDYRHDLDGYWSDRLWMALGAGAFVVRRASVGQPQLPYVGYYDEKVLKSIVHELVQDFGQRKQLGERARAAVMQKHTITHRCQEVIHLAENLARKSADAARTSALQSV